MCLAFTGAAGPQCSLAQFRRSLLMLTIPFASQHPEVTNLSNFLLREWQRDWSLGLELSSKGLALSVLDLVSVEDSTNSGGVLIKSCLCESACESVECPAPDVFGFPSSREGVPKQESIK
eukprot:Gregarina_sp_Poly_1__6043@NODE_318_length_9563_cov_157_467039_g272_i0_p10_GENE_NODE_318_length_9563_cov_157_467039_g272_i0NODE_318_length_9563_cov_157_467039_g272_i0_p10_ORF_typecomplete_len120_score13_83Phagetail_3/PF13550_6/0_14_NODE_318_length_9563_cov_157_467039_g272_i085918950